MLPTELDFGLGTFKGEPLVGVTMTGRLFHRSDHRGRYDLVTWTYDYVTDEGSCGVWQPCGTCFPGHPGIAQFDGTSSPAEGRVGNHGEPGVTSSRGKTVDPPQGTHNDGTVYAPGTPEFDADCDDFGCHEG